MNSCILDILETYQTLITGLLGFTGVIITMLVNAKNQRELQARQQEHEVRSLRVALKSELLANRKSYEGRIQQLREPNDNQDALLPNNIVDSIYQSLLNKIGLLSDAEVEKIHNAYLLVAELPYRLRLLVGTNNIGGHNNEFVRISRNWLNVAAQIHEAILPSIVEAVDTIDQQLNTQKNE